MSQLRLFVGAASGETAGKDVSMEQPSVAPALSRHDDPPTSREAAKRLPVRRLQQLAADLIGKAPGHTARELEFIGKVDAGVIHKRIAGLVRLGLVSRGPARRCRVSGYNATTLHLVRTFVHPAVSKPR